MTEHWLRLRAVLNENFGLLVGVLVVLAAVGGWIGYTAYAEPGTHVERHTGPEWTTYGEFDHGGSVEANTTAFDQGARLQNRSTYITAVVPVLDIAHSFRYTASGDGNLAVSSESRVIVRSTGDEREATPTEYWRVVYRTNATGHESVRPGEQLVVETSVDVPRLVDRIEQIREEIGGSVGSAEIIVRRTVSMRGTVNGDTVDRTETYTLVVDPGGTVYQVSGDGPETDSHASTDVVEVRTSYGPLRSVAAPLVAILSVIAVAGLGYARWTDRISLSPDERALLTYYDDRSDFDEWINTVRLPDTTFEYPRADTQTLGDLVDLAIDIGAPVVEDPEDGRYYVVHQDVLYTYEPPTASGPPRGDEPDDTKATDDEVAGEQEGVDDGNGDDGHGAQADAAGEDGRDELGASERESRKGGFHFEERSFEEPGGDDTSADEGTSESAGPDDSSSLSVGRSTAETGPDDDDDSAGLLDRFFHE